MILERREGVRTKGKNHQCKKHQTVASCMCPDWGPNPQARHVPWSGIEPVTFQFVGWRQTNWATLARAHSFIFRTLIFWSIQAGWLEECPHCDYFIMVPFNLWKMYAFISLLLPHVHGLMSCHLTVHFMVVSDRESLKKSYNYEDFWKHLWYERKITWIVSEDEGLCSLVNCLRRQSTGQEDRETWSSSWLRKGKEPGRRDLGQIHKERGEKWRLESPTRLWWVGISGLTEKVSGVIESILLHWNVIVILLSF